MKTKARIWSPCTKSTASTLRRNHWSSQTRPDKVFSTRVANIWNNLPADTTDFSSLRKFCASVSTSYDFVQFILSDVFTVLWATVCKTVRPIALCYQTVVCLSVLSVTLVYCRQTVGWIKIKLGTQVGLAPGHIVLDGDPVPPPRSEVK